MNSKIEFTFSELNALNKLLGKIKTESHLTADEINFFALSPFIISSIEKIHREYMNRVREQLRTGEFKTSGSQMVFDKEDDFQLIDKYYISNIENRLRGLAQQNKHAIAQMDKMEKEEYCDLIFAPFKPAENQRRKILNLLESMIERE